jgi:ATP-dependent Clp protease ATP-binding subunit ClpA
LFQRFTDRARRVVVLAQEEARMLNHGYVATEHILLGLIHEGEGIAADVLGSLNISLDAARQQVEGIIGRGRAVPAGHIPFTPRARQVLELSLGEARRLGHDFIGTEHLLLGLVCEGEGVAAQTLRNLGVDMPRVSQAVKEYMTGLIPGPAGVFRESALEPTEPESPFDVAERIVLGLIDSGVTPIEMTEVLGVSQERVGHILEAIVAKLRRILREVEDG